LIRFQRIYSGLQTLLYRSRLLQTAIGPMESRLRLLIVDADPGTRAGLKQALMMHPYVKQVNFANDWLIASKLAPEFDPHLVIISSTLFEDTISQQFDSLRNALPEAVRYIVLLHGLDRTVVKLVTTMIQGVHGFLAEPFSYEDIERLLPLVSEMEVKELVEREKLAVGALLDSMATLISSACPGLLRGDGPGQSIRGMRSQGQAIRAILDKDQDWYEGLLLKRFESSVVSPTYARLRREHDRELEMKVKYAEKERVRKEIEEAKAKAKAKASGPRVQYRSS